MEGPWAMQNVGALLPKVSHSVPITSFESFRALPVPQNGEHKVIKLRVDPTYFFQESILTEALHDTPTFEVP